MGRTVAELEHSLSDAELLEWNEYYKAEPFFADRFEYQMAQLTSTVFNILGEKSETTDFILTADKKEKEEKEPSGQELENLIFGAYL